MNIELVKHYETIMDSYAKRAGSEAQWNLVKPYIFDPIYNKVGDSRADMLMEDLLSLSSVDLKILMVILRAHSVIRIVRPSKYHHLQVNTGRKMLNSSSGLLSFIKAEVNVLADTQVTHEIISFDDAIQQVKSFLEANDGQHFLRATVPNIQREFIRCSKVIKRNMDDGRYAIIMYMISDNL